MTSQHTFNLLTRIWLGLGWLQPGQPLHEAKIPQDLLDTQPAIAEIIEEHRHHNPHASETSPLPSLGEGTGVRATGQPPLQAEGQQGSSNHHHALEGSLLPDVGERPGVRAVAATEIRTSNFELPQPQSEIQNPRSEMAFATPSVSPLEPEHPGRPESNSAPNETKKRSRAHCRGLTKIGNPCYAYRMHGGDLCALHNAKAINEADWERTADQFEPAAVAESKTSVVDLELLPVQLTDNASLRAFTEGVIRLELSGTLPANTSRRIASYLRIAQRTLPTAHERGPEPQPEEHQGRITCFVQAAPQLRHRLENQDIRQRDLDVEQAGRKREAILRMNRQYAPTPITRPPKLPSLRALMKY